MSRTTEEVRGIVDEISKTMISEILEGKNYNAETAVEWANNISNKIVTKLKDTENYKFFVTTIIMCKGESGLTMAGACLWNSERDGSSVIKQEIDDMVCIVNTFFSPTSYA